MATITPERRRVTLTIPAENVDDFRVGLLADINSNAGGFNHEHEHMLDVRKDRREFARKDRDSRIDSLRELCVVLEQLPDEDVTTTLSGTEEALRFALEDAGRALMARLASEFDYCPVPVENVLPLLDRLRWTAEQVATIEQGA
jgi:hypothetical protein